MKHLYKYRADNKYTELLFTSRRVRLSTAKDLNDPFECSLQEIAKDWISARVREMKQAHLMGFLVSASPALEGKASFYGLTPAQTEQLFARLRDIPDFDEQHSALLQFLRERCGVELSDPRAPFSGLDSQLNKIGIFSVSEVPDHQLLWAHYAGDHKGICIGFEAVDGSKLGNEEHCLKVVYSDTLPKMDVGFIQQLEIRFDRGFRKSSSRIAFSDPTLRAAISTKSTFWSYEQEWRYVEAKGGDYAWPGPISEVVFGLRCPPDRREHYSRLVSENVLNDVRFFEMRKVANTNRLERVPVAIHVSRSRLTKEAPMTKPGTNRDDPCETDVSEEVEELIENGQTEKALDLLDRALSRSPNLAPLWHLKGVALGASGRHQEALQCFDHCTELHPGIASGWYHKGVALSALGRYAASIESYQRARQLDPEDASAALNIGAVLCQVGKGKLALPHLLDAKRLGHERADQALASCRKLLR
jgi:tetratricopeptide (TPR) repeat protein